MAAETTPEIINEIVRMRKQAQAVRNDVEYRWEVSYKLLNGSSESATFNNTQSDAARSRYIPYSNRIANAVNIKYAALTEMMERPVILPRSAEEPALVYMSRSGMSKLAATNSTITQPLSQFDEINVRSVPHPQDPTGQNPLFDDNDFVVVNNDLAADGITEELQSEWLKSKSDNVLNKAKYQKIIIGHSDLMVQWDDKKKNYELLHLNPYNVWIDPLAINTFDAEFVLVRQIFPLSKAIEKWPEFKEKFKEFAGDLNTNNGWTATTNKLGNLGSDRGYPNDAKLIEHITAYLRNSGGYAIRQVEYINDIVLTDAECPYSDIPVVRDIHIPRATSNYGVGDPEYLWELQDLYRRMLSIIYEHSLYSRASMHILPATVLNQLKGYLTRAYTLSGQFLPVSDDQFMMHGGQPIRELKPPELSPSVFATLQFVSAEIDRLSGNTDISRGEAKAGWSGALYEQATSNARSPIGMTARHTVIAIKYLMGIVVKMILEDVSPQELEKRNRAYPAEVWKSMRDRIAGLEYDFEVQVSGASKKEGDFQKFLSAAHNMPSLWMAPSFVKAVAAKGDFPDGKRLAMEIQQAQQAQQAQQMQQAQPQQPAQPAQ